MGLAGGAGVPESLSPWLFTGRRDRPVAFRRREQRGSPEGLFYTLQKVFSKRQDVSGRGWPRGSGQPQDSSHALRGGVFSLCRWILVIPWTSR